MTDSNPRSWRDAKIAQYEAAARDVGRALVEAYNLEHLAEAEGDLRRLQHIRIDIGFLREWGSFLTDRARLLRAQARDLEEPPALTMAVTRRIGR